MQRHMDHFREAKLYQDEELILEGVEGYIGCREKTGHRREWHGYFLIGADYHLDPTHRFQLVLDDGSTATIRASDINECHDADGQKHAVEYYVIGEFRGGGRRRYGIDHEGRRSLST